MSTRQVGINFTYITVLEITIGIKNYHFKMTRKQYVFKIPTFYT